MHRKEVWKEKFKLTFILIQLSEMFGAGRVNAESRLMIPFVLSAKSSNNKQYKMNLYLYL